MAPPRCKRDITYIEFCLLTHFESQWELNQAKDYRRYISLGHRNIYRLLRNQPVVDLKNTPKDTTGEILL